MPDEIQTGAAHADRSGAPPLVLKRHRPSSRMLHVAGAAVVLAALGGCAGAKVNNVTAVNAGGPPPVEILVAVDSALPPTDAQAKVATEVGSKLRSDLVAALTKAHITAEPFVPGTSHRGSAVLHVSITQVDPGNAVERFVIGFGTGRAELQVAADLQSTDTPEAQSITTFNTASDTGRKPGLVLPGGIALATRDLAHLAIGGAIKVASSVGDDLDKPVGKTATAIVTQMKKYYVSVGWYWPATA